MSNETKDLKESIQQNSVCINDGIFLLRVKKSDVNDDDFLKECVYGDAFPSAYSPHVSMIPTSVFLPKMLSGKTLFRDHKVTFKDSTTNRLKTEMIQSIDSLPPFAFLIHEHGDTQIETMYDDVFKTKDELKYSEKRRKINTSLDSHLPNVKTTFHYPNEGELLLNNDRPDEDISAYLKENDECYTVLFITQYSSIILQDSDENVLKFGDKNDPLYVELPNDRSARFDGVSNNEENCSVILPKSITLAIKRELLTLTQLYVGFEKQPGCIIEDYIHNMKCIFSRTYEQARNLKDMESYLVSALTLFFNQNLGQEQRGTKSKPILNDNAYKDTLKTKIMFQILMMVDRNSSFNMRTLKYKQDGTDKSYIMCDDVYTNPFMSLTSAVYFNRSWLEHLLTLSTFFNKRNGRFACETCEQHVCAINAVGLLFPHSVKPASKRERTNALLAYHSPSTYNKTGPMGNLQTKKSDNALDTENIVVWEKYYENLYRTVIDNYALDLEMFAEQTETTSDNFKERAERIFDHISETIDNIVACCDEFCKGLNHGAESIYGVKVVESEIRNQLVNLYDKGTLNVLLSESFLYIVRSLVLLEDEKQFNTKSLDSWICAYTEKFKSDNKFCIIPKKAKDITLTVELPRIAIKSYDENQTTVNVSTEKQTSYNLTKLLTQVTFKNKVFLYSRHDESKSTNKRKSTASMVQNMGNSSASSNILNSTFAKFKQSCGQRTLQVLKTSDLEFINTLGEIRDSKLDKHAYLFKNIKDFNINEWSFIVMLITNYKMLEYLMFIPAYDRTNFLVFNKLAKSLLPGKEVMFDQSLICDEFNLCESVYGMKTTISQFNSESKGLIKKIAGKYLDSNNELLSNYIKKGENPGPGVPIFYLPIGEKNIRSKEKADILDQFIHEQQYHLEKEAGYTNYIKSNRKQFYDSVFYATFGELADRIENRYCSEIQEEMLSEFDDNFPPNLFINEAVQTFLKLVITEYLNTDQSAVQIMMSRLKEISTRQTGIKRKSDNEIEEGMVDFNLVNQFADDNDDTESMFLSKKAKLQ